LRVAHFFEFESKPPTDLPSSICFRQVGQAVMNTDLVDGTKNVQVHFKSSPHFGTTSHGYNANNAFLLNIGGKPVFLRTGRRDMYGSPHHKNWMWHSRSDNAILVNGEGQYKRSLKAKGRILAFETSPHIDVVAGEAGTAYENLDRWTRRLIFFKPHAILIHDILEAPEPSSFQWMLHTPGEFDISGQEATWKGDAGAVKTRFLYPADLGITQTDQYDPPPAEWTGWTLGEWHLTAEPAAKAKRQEFLTLVTINQAAVEAVVAPGAAPRAVTITLPDGEAQVTFEDHAFAVKSAGFNKRFEEE
jgi:heparinase II/III-like protein